MENITFYIYIESYGKKCHIQAYEDLWKTDFEDLPGIWGIKESPGFWLRHNKHRHGFYVSKISVSIAFYSYITSHISDQ